MTNHAPPRPDKQLSPSIFAIAFAGVFIFLYLWTVLLPATPVVVTNDQVLFFSRAVRIVHGQVLYRDFFELVTPGTDLLYAAAFRLFGIHAWLIPAWSITVGLALCSLITLIASKILRGPLLLLPALSFLVFDFSTGLDLTHHWYSTLFALAAVAVLAEGEGATLRQIAAASSLSAMATLFTQTKGVLVFLALVVYVLWLKRFRTQTSNILKQLAALILPFAAVLSSVLGYYIHRAGFRTFFFDLVTFPMKYMSGDDSNSPRLYLRQLHPMLAHHAPSDIIRLIPFLFIYALVPYTYLFGLHQLWSKRTMLPPALRQHLVLLHLVGLALFLAIANGPSFFRLGAAAPPAILIFIWLISRQSPTLQLVRRALWILALFFAVLLPIYRQTQWHATLDLPIGRTAFNDILTFQEYQWLAQHTHPSELFFNEFAAGFYLSLSNPTPSEFTTEAEFTRPEEVAAILQSLQHNPPPFVVLPHLSTNAFNPHDHSAPFLQYIHANYHLDQIFPVDHAQFSRELWERGPAPNQTQ
jgi:hypothetical protein